MAHKSADEVESLAAAREGKSLKDSRKLVMMMKTTIYDGCLECVVHFVQFVNKSQ